MQAAHSTRTLVVCGMILVAVAASSHDVAAQTDPSLSRPQRGSAISGLSIANLDASQVANMIIDLYPQGSGPMVVLTRSGVPAEASANLYLPAEVELANGRYAGIVSSDRPTATTLRTDWPAASDAAAYSNARPGKRHILPVMAGFDPRPALERTGLGLRHHSVVDVQNTDTRQAAAVELRLRDAAGRLLDDRTLAIGPGRSISLEQEPNSPLRSLPFDALGSLELVSDLPIAVASHVGLEPWPTAAMGFESSPADLAARTLFAPMLSSSDWSSRILLVNPGDAPASLRVEYRANADASGSPCSAGPIIERPAAPLGPRETLLLDQSPLTGSLLGDGCWASATIHSDRELLGVVLLLQSEQRAAAAYRLKRADEAGHRFAHLLIRHRHTLNEFSTAIQVQNPGPRELEVRLEIQDHQGGRVECPGCSGRVPAGGSRMWLTSDIEGLSQRSNFWGYARIVAEGPVLANVLEYSANGRYDAVIYDGLSMDEPVGGWPPVPENRYRHYLPVVAVHALFKFSPWIDMRFLPSVWRSHLP